MRLQGEEADEVGQVGQEGQTGRSGEMSVTQYEAERSVLQRHREKRVVSSKQ